MCGRFNYVISEGMITLLDEFGVHVSGTTRYNLAPTEQVPIIRNAVNSNQLTQARWWLVPSWSDGPNSQFAMFNAKAETLETSRAFKEPFKHKRCLIPATSYIEWKSENGQKQAYEIYSDAPLLMAGIWDQWRDEITSCSMITTQANERLAAIHKRMPVMLSPEHATQWLDMRTPYHELKPLLHSRNDQIIHYEMIDNTIGNVRNKSKPIKISGNQNMNLF